MKELEKLLKDKTTGIFALTLSGYLAAYVFEVSYLKVFGINWRFAQVETPLLIMAALSTVFTLVLADNAMVLIRNPFVTLAKGINNNSIKRFAVSQIRIASVFIMTYSFIFYAPGGSGSEDYIFNQLNKFLPAIGLYFLLTTYMPALFWCIRKRSFSKGLEKFHIRKDASLDEDKKMVEGSLMSQSRYILAWVALLVAGSYVAGTSFAVGKNTFPAVCVKESNYVIVRAYSDKSFLKPVSQKELTEGYRILKLEDNKSLIMLHEVVVGVDISKAEGPENECEGSN